MDNQIYIGYGYSSANAYNPQYATTSQTTTSSSANFGVEQLFNNNVWLSMDGSFIYSASQTTLDNGLPSFTAVQNIGLPGAVSGKVGYSFNSSNIGLQVIPYLTTGVMLNYNGASLLNNGFMNSYYVLYGGGARAEYVVLPNRMSIYFDQMVGYLSDHGNYTISQSAMDYNSVLGVRYNVTNHLQLGLQGSLDQINFTGGQNVGYNPNTRTPSNTNQTNYGGMFTVAYLFDNTADYNLHSYGNQYLAKFDNNYSLGYGFANSNNSYSAGNLSTIGSSLSFLNLEATHLFDNNVWAKINGQLITSMTQTNIPNGMVASKTPTYLGFPGSATADVGYAFVLPNTDVQLIPYINGGIIANINSYNANENTSISYVLSHDYFAQYGVGGRAEHAVNQYWQLYFDQLFAMMNDRSSMGLNAWRSTSTIGTKVNLTNAFQVGLSGFYDAINPTSNTTNITTGVNYAAQQNTYGGIVSIGISY
jgi:hypothetical protein